MKKARKICVFVLLLAVMFASLTPAVRAEECVHEYVAQQEPATCTENGVRYFICTKCGDTYGHESISPLGHLYDQWEPVTASDCTHDGQESRSCARCGFSEERKIPATGHDYATDVVDPSCIKSGYTLLTCERCGDTEKTDPVDPLGHRWISQVVAPACAKDGYTLLTCERCGETQKQDPTEKTGHTYDGGVVTKEATTTAMGRITYTCTACGDSHIETTPKLVNPFGDVKSSAYYFRAVLWAADRGVTSGTDESHFSPNARCTRAQVVTFLWRAMGAPEPEGTECPFVDVSENSYYRKAVLWALDRGITAGVDATHFGSDAYCTRAQVMTFLYRAKGSPEWQGSQRFSDVRPSDYYYLSVSWAADNGITSGVDGAQFGSHQTCTRAQIVTFLYKADALT